MAYILLSAVVIVIISRPSQGYTFTFKGASVSYAALTSWSICDESMLSLEFKTSQPNGLILYQDDGGRFDFIEIKLVEGRLKMRLKFAEDHLLTYDIGEQVHNGVWHRLTVQRMYQRTRLLLDDLHETETANFEDVQFGDRSSKPSLLFLGGLPSEFEQDLDQLTLPSVFYERRFHGVMRNMLYTSCTGEAINPVLMSHEGLDSELLSGCNDNVCSNGGICHETNLGLMCDCTDTGYKGDFCQIEQEQPSATFAGSEFISYNFSGKAEPIRSTTETIQFSFKTAVSDGFIFFTGDESSYLNIGLHKGVVYLSTRMNQSEPSLDYIGTDGQLDDDVWHKVVIVRVAEKLTLTVDGRYETSRIISGNFGDLTSRVLYVGGALSPRLIPGVVASQNFYGCLRGVKFIADTVQLNLLRMAKLRDGLLSQHGRILFDQCVKVIMVEPISIQAPGAHIKLQSIKDPRESFLSVTFVTNEGNGLILYCPGIGWDVFALELVHGYLYSVLQQGDQVMRTKLYDHHLNDRDEHHVAIDLRVWGASVMVDGVPKTVSVGNISHLPLNLRGPVYLAGIDYNDEDIVVHPAVRMATQRTGFLGCVMEVKVDGILQNLKQLSAAQGMHVSDKCANVSVPCTKDACAGGARCRESWNEVACECWATGSSGAYCSQDAVTMRFDGKQHFTVTPMRLMVSMSEHVTLRFLTKYAFGTLLTTRSADGLSRLEIILMGGRLLVKLSMAGLTTILSGGSGLNDNRWHLLQFSREEAIVNLTVDNITTATSDLSKLIRPNKRKPDWMMFIFSITQLSLGRAVPFNTDGAGSGATASEHITGHSSDELLLKPFVGYIQQFHFNGNDYFGITKHSSSKEVSYTSSKSLEPLPPFNILSVSSAMTYMTSGTLQTSPILNIYFRFKTTEENGLLFYSPGNDGDFLYIELIRSQLNYFYKRARSETSLKSSRNSPLSDNQWHDVLIMLHNGDHYMRVDSTNYSAQVHDSTEGRLTGPLYIAGIPWDMYAKFPGFSADGFKGCLASMEIGDIRPDLYSVRVGPKGHISSQCADQGECSESTCDNGGKCSSEPSEPLCQCDMTSYTGPTCAENSTTYQFGGDRGGSILYQLPKPGSDTFEDQLAFGLITGNSNCTVIQILSGNSLDYIEVSLQDGKVYVQYNIGTVDHAIAVAFVSVDNYKYHVVRFTRTGSNSTLQVDAHPIVPKYPAGEQLTVFNNVDKIVIGGRLNRHKNITERRFTGLISGVVFNGIRVLDLCKESHPNVTVQGEVQLVDLSQSNFGRSKPTSLHEELPGEKMSSDDDIVIYSGHNSPCQDDLEDCTGDADSGEIISASVLSASKSAPTTNIPFRNIPSSSSKPAGNHFRGSSVTHLDPTMYGSVDIEPIQIAHNSQAPVNSATLSTTESTFDLQKNIPLVAGICGAALLTVIIISIVVCRLTRKPSSDSRPQKDEASSTNHNISINDLQNNIQSLHMNGSKKSNSKEWYV